MAAAPAWAAEDAASSDAEPLVLEPSSGWMVGFTGDSCVLAREFGSDAHAVTLRFIKDAPGDGFDAQAIGKPLALALEPASSR